MAVDYSDWASGAQIVEYMTLNGYPPKVGASDELLLARIAAMAAKIEQMTKRQFKAGAVGEVRYFDGSGTAVMEIDDYLDVTQILVHHQGASNGLAITDYVQVETAHYPKTRIYLMRGTRPVWGHYYMDKFPEGYGNVEVTAQWGYGATIPADVWYAHVLMVMGDTGNSEQVTAAGLPWNFKEGDVSETYYQKAMADAAGWMDQVKTTIANYERSAGRHLRTAQPKYY